MREAVERVGRKRQWEWAGVLGGGGGGVKRPAHEQLDAVHGVDVPPPDV